MPSGNPGQVYHVGPDPETTVLEDRSPCIHTSLLKMLTNLLIIVADASLFSGVHTHVDLCVK
jgi:hypothetical protein